MASCKIWAQIHLEIKFVDTLKYYATLSRLETRGSLCYLRLAICEGMFMGTGMIVNYYLSTCLKHLMKSM